MEKSTRGTNDIEGRLALITGASGGIGSACALHLAAHSVDLALTYSTNRAPVDNLASRLAKEHPKLRVSTHQLDLADASAIQKTVQAVMTEHGRAVDILISNAGYGKRISEIEDIPLDEFDHMINVNLKASFVLAKETVPGMRAQKWGRIVFVSSIAAYGGGINGCHYAASKGGMQGMMRNLATHLAPDNISVNDVSPAMVGNTGMLANANVPEIVDKIPLGRLCEPEEVANIVAMFCTTGYVTGQSLLATGGLK